MIDEENLFDQPVKNIVRTYANILKTSVGQGNDYATGCLLDYLCSKELFQMIAIDLSKQMLIQKQYNQSILLEI